MIGRSDGAIGAVTGLLVNLVEVATTDSSMVFLAVSLLFVLVLRLDLGTCFWSFTDVRTVDDL